MNITLITSCYNLSKFNYNKRPIDECINMMKELLQIPMNMVIFTENELFEIIKAIRSPLDHMTIYIKREINKLELYKYYNDIKIAKLASENINIRNRIPEHEIILGSKWKFLMEIIDMNPFDSNMFFWIDAHLGDKFRKITKNYYNRILQRCLYKTNPNKFHIVVQNSFNKKYLLESNKKEYYSMRCYIALGGLFGGNGEITKKYMNKLLKHWINDIKYGLLGDEMIMCHLIKKNYKDIHYSYGDYHTLLDNFIEPKAELDYIYNLIIKQNCDLENYKETILCCKSVLCVIDKNKVNINYELYMKILLYYYLARYYYTYNTNDKDKFISRYFKISNLVNLINNVKNNYPLIEKYYDIYKDRLNYIEVLDNKYEALITTLL